MADSISGEEEGQSAHGEPPAGEPDVGTEKRYEEEALPEDANNTAGFTVEANARGDHLLMGSCPRCHHPMEFLVVNHLVRSTIPEPEVVFCRCRRNHPGRSEGEVGCGATWAVRITP